MFKKRDVKNRRPMPMGNPANFELGSAESRAAARAMVDAIRYDTTLILIHNIPRPEYESRPAPERTEDGAYVLRITSPER
jgi:hypothetical protein